jgi:hypothetical protein
MVFESTSDSVAKFEVVIAIGAMLLMFDISICFCDSSALSILYLTFH